MTMIRIFDAEDRSESPKPGTLTFHLQTNKGLLFLAAEAWTAEQWEATPRSERPDNAYMLDNGIVLLMEPAGG